MATHFMSLNDPWFTYVKNGEKKFEGRRANHNKVSIMNVGDLIQFHHHTDKTQLPFIKKIKNILKFTTFEEALKTLPLSEVLPYVISVEEGVKIYFQFVSLPTQLQHGVVMIELE